MRPNLPRSTTPTPARRPLLRRTAAAALVASLMGCGFAVGSPAWATGGSVGSNVEVTVVERDSGTTSPIHHHRGQWFVAGRPGARYAIRIANRTGERVLAVMSVDGVNIVTGQTASFDQSGYVLAPWQSAEITGWRKSPREVAAFVFTALPDSYAARTGRPHDVGVIGVAVFKERVVRPPVQITPPDTVGRADAPAAAEQERSRDEGGARAAAGSNAARAGAPSAQAASPAPAAPALQERLGTGHGEREPSYASRTRFDRSTTSPVEIVSIRYDSHENLVLAGVIPPPVWARPNPNPNPNPFPRTTSGYVPDPPRW